MSFRHEKRVLGKAVSTTVVFPHHAPGTIFTNEGAAGAITFTLPTASLALLGVEYDFLGIVDQNITVAVPGADTAIALNDLAADSLSLSTASQKIGGRLRATCVKTGPNTYQWVLQNVNVGHAGTVAT